MNTPPKVETSAPTPKSKRLEDKLRHLMRESFGRGWTKAQCLEWIDLYEKDYVEALADEGFMHAGRSWSDTPLGEYYGSVLKQYVDLDRRELASAQAQSAGD